MGADPSESAAGGLGLSNLNLILGLRAERVRLLEGMALLAGPVLEDPLKAAQQFAQPQARFWYLI
jgi:hypothetical protein